MCFFIAKRIASKLFCCLDKVGVVDTVVNVESYFNVRMAEPSRNNLDRNTRAQSSVSESVAQNVKAERFINSDRGTKTSANYQAKCGRQSVGLKVFVKTLSEVFALYRLCERIESNSP